MIKEGRDVYGSEHCQSPATGLFAWGEHIGWDFSTRLFIATWAAAYEHTQYPVFLTAIERMVDAFER